MSSSLVSGRLVLRPIVREEVVLPSIKPKLFVKHVMKSINKMEKNVENYLIDPNEENIHDVRTSIRRLDAALRLLPKNIRKQSEISDLRAIAKNFFKINSDIRDMDIIKSKFTKYPQDITSRYPDFLNSLEEHRETKLKEAKRTALDVYNLNPSAIKLAKVPRKKLQRRSEKVTANFVDSIEGLFPIVIAASDKQRELHQMRKDCKKLRYVLETGGSSAKMPAARQLDGAIHVLEEVQEILGAIHDSDMMLLHLARVRGGHAKASNGSRGDDYQDLIALESNERLGLYNQFVFKFAARPLKKGNKSLGGGKKITPRVAVV
jgi:CHAD domain-containing protein